MPVKKTISFSKMQGAGNDFVVIDNRNRMIDETELPELVPALCDRKFGIGADGILLLQTYDHTRVHTRIHTHDHTYEHSAVHTHDHPLDQTHDQTHDKTKDHDQDSTLNRVDYRMIYKNADGSDAGMCGNGGRCIALFATSLGIKPEHHFIVNDSVYRASVEDDGITIHFPSEYGIQKISGPSGENLYQIYAGTEHVVMETGADMLADDTRLFSLGRQLRYDSLFKPAGTNVNFFNVINTGKIRVRTYERGVENLTLACGTGSIASAITVHNGLDNPASEGKYTVKCDGGLLEVGFTYNSDTKNYSQIKLKGSAQFVFKGTIDI